MCLLAHNWAIAFCKLCYQTGGNYLKGTDRDDNNLLELSQQRQTERTSGNGEEKGEASPVET